jgi:acetylxylan esterase
LKSTEQVYHQDASSKLFFAGLSTAVPTVNRALTRVTNYGNNPANLQTNINIPAKFAEKSAIIVAVGHSNLVH